MSSLVGREELLTEHALRWNKHKVENMAGTLAQRYVKVRIPVINMTKYTSQKFILETTPIYEFS